jgi:uncharacterized membrane protein YeaQ/YmgE (transglycosylase-associated protein family)
MSIIVAIIIGLIVGIIAKLLMPGRDPGGFIITALLGIGGFSAGHCLGAILRLLQARRACRIHRRRHRSCPALGPLPIGSQRINTPCMTHP